MTTRLVVTVAGGARAGASTSTYSVASLVVELLAAHRHVFVADRIGHTLTVARPRQGRDRLTYVQQLINTETPPGWMGELQELIDRDWESPRP